MSISQTLVQSQNQSLKMTDAMSVSLKVMQMSSIDLTSFVNKELQENPLLSEDEPENKNSELSFNNLKVRKYDYEFNIEDIESEVSIHQKVADQIEISKLNPQQRLIAHYLAEYLNSSGYLECSFSAISERLKCKLSDIEVVVTHLQDFEPTGIFARNLSECLALQMKERGLLNKKSQIVLNNLEMLAKNEISKLSKLAGTNITEILEIIQEIKKLNPKPCSHLSKEKAYSKIPDVIITREDDEEFSVMLASSNLPKIILSKKYYDDIKSKLRDKEGKKYLSDQYMRASNLMKAVEKRKETILKTAIAIFEKQRSFFEYGIMELKPMTLSEVASMIMMHESTVSRITNGKYIETPFGVFEMKDFFTSKVKNDHGIDISSAKIKEMIKAIISAESREHIYSDDEISGELKKYQLSAARRTVAKYREEMRIPTSAERKRKVKTTHYA
jgi:RNA polymerase sigma-54 factor